jgi:hypothetical protein
MAKTLSIFFSLDNDLPAAGYLMVGMPTGASHTPSGTGVHVWALATSFAVPATATNAGTCSWSSPTLSCTFASALTKKTAYGMAIPGTGAVVGMFAPITMKTRMNNIVSAGPVLDTNHVFDAIATAAAAPTISLAVAKVTAAGATELKYGGEQPVY